MISNVGMLRTSESAAVLALLVIFAAFVPALGGLWTAWQSAEYSHGILIPLIAILIGWHRMAQCRPAREPSRAGLPVIFAGFALLGVSRLAAFAPPAYYGLWLCLCGLALAFYGWRTLRTLAPAFVFLLFAIPLPRLIEVGLTAHMQIISTTLGVALLQLFGVTVFQDGNVIDLGAIKLQVAEACSGLRYMFPLLSLSYLIAFLFAGPLWKRAVIFLSAVPLTIGMNGLRIALAGVFVNFWGPGAAEGFIHFFEGWVVFLLCVVVLLAEMWALMRAGRSGGRFRHEYLQFPGVRLLRAGSQTARTGGAALILCVFCAAALGMTNYFVRPEAAPARISFTAFPLVLGSWVGRPEALSRTELDELRATDSWHASYILPDNARPVDLFMAYYASQRVGASAHSPSNCVPGSGWRVMDRQTVTVALDNVTLPVTRMVIRKDGVSLLVYYWFDQRGRIMNEQYSVKWYLFVDSIFRHRTDGAVIRLMTPLTGAEGERDGDTHLREFMRALYPAIHSYIPGV